jgi:hypothetical protein
MLHFTQKTEEAMKLFQTSLPKNTKRSGSLEQKVRLLVRRHRAARRRRCRDRSRPEDSSETPGAKPRHD